MNKNGFKIIESKRDRENILKKNFPALGLFYVKLEKMLPKGVFKQVYISNDTISIFDYDYRLNIKYTNSIITSILIYSIFYKFSTI
jgi:hypothetical protein